MGGVEGGGRRGRGLEGGIRRGRESWRGLCEEKISRDD